MNHISFVLFFFLNLSGVWSGSIPAELEQLKNLEQIYLIGNKLAGKKITFGGDRISIFIESNRNQDGRASLTASKLPSVCSLPKFPAVLEALATTTAANWTRRNFSNACASERRVFVCLFVHEQVRSVFIFVRHFLCWLLPAFLVG
jgi:hypothetical protein